MVAFRRTAKNLTKKQNKNRKQVKNKHFNWFENEIKADFKGTTQAEKLAALWLVEQQLREELWYKHNLNMLPLKQEIISYILSLCLNRENEQLAEKLNTNPYIYTGLAWFEAFAFPD